jgi:hypothetical protein
MEGIAGGLQIRRQGIVRYEVLDDKGELQVLETSAYLIPGLQCRLFSPQAYFTHLYEIGADPEDTAHLVTRHEAMRLVWNKTVMTICYDRATFLPRIRAYKDAVNTATTLSLQGCVTEEVNQNLTSAQKTLLRWHFRLGHIAFAAVQWLGRQGYLGDHGNKMGHTQVEAPKCAACQLGKQGKRPIPTKHGTHEEVGSLSKEKLEPGDLVFIDQYESRQPGRALTTKGIVSSSLQ